MAQVIWTDKSVGNLEFIHSYITLDSVVYADRFIKDLVKRAQILEAFPASGRVVPEFQIQLAQGKWFTITTESFTARKKSISTL